MNKSVIHKIKQETNMALSFFGLRYEINRNAEISEIINQLKNAETEIIELNGKKMIGQAVPIAVKFSKTKEKTKGELKYYCTKVNVILLFVEDEDVKLLNHTYVEAVPDEIGKGIKCGNKEYNPLSYSDINKDFMIIRRTKDRLSESLDSNVSQEKGA